jgi:hypothetical protein
MLVLLHKKKAVQLSIYQRYIWYKKPANMVKPLEKVQAVTIT